MPNYNQSKIYKIWSPSTGLTYFGSTTQKLAQRLAEHKARPNCKSSLVIEQDDYCIELLEDYPCCNRTQLLRKEGEWIKNNTCVNKIVAGRTASEYVIDNIDAVRATQKRYNDANKEKHSQYYKAYYIANKEKIDQQHKEYKLFKKQNK